MTPASKRRLKYTLAFLLLVAVALPFVPADLFRARIQYALEQGLGRKVEIGAVHFTLLPSVLPGPGFTIDQVVIHEDERAGAEPFAYVDSLGASVRLRSLFSRRLEFSSLNLGDATINIVKTEPGPWNFQFLLAGASANTRAMPSIRMRGGRLNFKFGDTKSVFYFNNADLDVQPSPDGSFALRFGGAPSRSNRTAQEFGRLFVSGNSSADHQLNFTAELDRAELEETLRWIVPGAHGLHGVVAMTAQVEGPSSNLSVTGRLEIGDVHRWDVLPAKDSAFRTDFTGTLNLSGEQLNLASVSSSKTPAPVAYHLRVSRWLSAPAFTASAELQEVPLGTLVKIARHMGAAIPDQVAAEGPVSGTLEYSDAQGLTGNVELGESAVSLAGEARVEASSAAVTIANGLAKLEKTVVTAGESQSAEIDGSYALNVAAGETRETNLRIVTRGFDAALMRSFAAAEIPAIAATPQGLWRGQLRYHSGDWTGDFELRNAQVQVEGLALPVQIESGVVSVNGPNVAVTKLRAQAGDVAFTGELHLDPEAEHPYRFALNIPEVDGVALGKLLAPTLFREGGFFSRTLRLGASPKPPEWLDARQAEGTIAIEAMSLGDSSVHGLRARVLWEGSNVRLTSLKADVDGSLLSGELKADLAPGVPQVRFKGKLDDYAWHGGVVSLDGKLDAGIESGDFLGSIRAQGKLLARSIAFTPDADFRTVAGAFEWQGFGATAKWKLSNLDLAQAGESLTGAGSTQPDGKLQLDLVSKGKPVRYSAAVFPALPQP